MITCMASCEHFVLFAIFSLPLSKTEQRLSLVLIMIAVIFIVSSVPRIVIMMYDVIIIDTLRWGKPGQVFGWVYLFLKKIKCGK